MIAQTKTISIRKRVPVLLACLAAAFFAALPSGAASLPQVEKVRIGPHPEYTRIIVQLSEPAKYDVEANFIRKRITLKLNRVRVNPAVRSRTFKDRNLEKINVRTGKGTLDIVFHLKSTNTRFFHFLDAEKARIVVDLKAEKKPVIQTEIGNSGSGLQTPGPERTAKRFPPQPQPAESGRKATVAGMTPAKLRALNRQNVEDRLVSGLDEYQAALKTYQDRNYPEAVKLFGEFMDRFPDSKYLDHIVYLNAEAKFQIAFREPNPIYEDALDAYKKAIRQFPKSPFAAHATDKIAFIFSEMGFILEAKTIYENVLKEEPDSPYTPSRKTSLASMMLKEGRYEDAHTAFKRLLVKSPKNIEARDAIFQIADHYYEVDNPERALEIYEDGERRWPSELNNKPQIHFNMGDIYYRQKRYGPAREHFYSLINLVPAHPQAHRALNLIGDSYLIERQYLNALAVFDESAKRNPESAAAQYGKIRMADIGILDPRLKVQEVIYDSSPYYQPFETYEAVLRQAKDVDILAEATLSRGVAHLKEQSYLKALTEFKKLLPMGPDTTFHMRAKKYIKQTLVFLVDKYSRQGGVLPILYSYSDFVSLSLGEVNNTKTLLQIGEAYQAIGMYPQALKFYERIREMDSRKLYRDRIFLNLGQIHLEQKNFKEAELIAKSFTKNYPQSPRLPEAMKLLAQSHAGRQQFKKALRVYQQLALKEKGGAHETQYLIAETHYSLNDLPKAVRHYLKAIGSFDRTIKIVPDHIRRSYYRMGIALFQMKRYAQASRALESARNLFPEHPLRDWADYLLADIYQQLKDTPKLNAKLNTLIQSGETDALIKQAAESKLRVLNWEKEFKESL